MGDYKLPIKVILLLQIILLSSSLASDANMQRLLKSTQNIFTSDPEIQKYASMLLIGAQEDNHDTFIDSMKSSGFFCSSCESFFQKLLDTNSTKTEQELTYLIEFGCSVLKIEQPSVCLGAVSEMAPSVMQNFLDRYIDPHFACPHLKLCPAYYENVDIKNLTNSIIQNKPQYTRPTPSKEKTFKVLHMTDLHFDNLYAENTNAHCKFPDCCRVTSGKPESDASKSGYWGTLADCDIPFRTIEGMVSYIKRNLAHELDFIVWTGDNTNHFVWEQTYESNTEQTIKITDLLRRELPNIPVFPISGNHESFPVNVYDYFGDHEKQQNNLFATNWEQWIGKEAADMFRQNGFYSLVLPKYGQNLRIIAINTQAGNNMNWYLIRNPTDPKGQLKWFRQQLQLAEDNNEKVFIIGHIPSNSQLQEWADVYSAIIERYAHVIVSQFQGHTHTDSIQAYRDSDTNKINNIAFIAPSVTTYGSLNPSFRIFEVDHQTLLPINYFQYRLNLTDINNNKVKDVNKVNFELAYDFNSYYGYSDMSNLQNFEDLVSKIASDLNTFQRYQFAYHSGNANPLAPSIQKYYFCDTYSTPEQTSICNTNQYKKDILAQIFGTWFTKVNNKEDLI